jgi:phosphate transport system protein
MARTVEARLHFHEELSELEQRALGALDLVVATLERTMRAVAEQDPDLASVVVEDDDRLDGRYLEVHLGLLSLIARQAPVATDLRLIAALLEVVGHAERMGDQCVNIAKLVPLAEKRPVGHEQMLAKLAEMGTHAAALVAQSGDAFSKRDVALAEDLVRRDDVLDRLNRDCFSLALELGDDPDRREWAMHMMFVARWLERVGDHAVDIGEQTAFVVTGLFREFTDASHPDPAS